MDVPTAQTHDLCMFGCVIRADNACAHNTSAQTFHSTCYARYVISLFTPCAWLFALFAATCSSQNNIVPLPELLLVWTMAFFLIHTTRATAVNKPSFHG